VIKNGALVKRVTGSMTLSDLESGTYQIEAGIAYQSGTLYTTVDTSQAKVINGADAAVTVTYELASAMNVVISATTCETVLVGETCTLTFNLVNNTRTGLRWVAVSLKENSKFSVLEITPIGLTEGCKEPLAHYGYSIIDCYLVKDLEGNGAVIRYTLRREGLGSTRLVNEFGETAFPIVRGVETSLVLE
jgi:hypothetical protein